MMATVFSYLPRLSVSVNKPEPVAPSSPQPEETGSIECSSRFFPAPFRACFQASFPIPTYILASPPSAPNPATTTPGLHPALIAASAGAFGKPSTGWVCIHIKPSGDTIELVMDSCFSPSAPTVGHALAEYSALLVNLSEKIFKAVRRDRDLPEPLRVMKFTLDSVFHYIGGCPLFESFAMVVFGDKGEMEKAVKTEERYVVGEKMRVAIKGNVEKHAGPLFDGFDEWVGKCSAMAK
ncbi:hypothetical protein IAT38_003068 [Cryptococcus sp. DSM 104549]